MNFQEKAPLIIWVHGLGGQRDLDLRIPIEFTKRGFYVVCIDYQGHGESQGNKTHINPHQIGIVGHSLGGCIALMNYALDNRFNGIVTWSAFVNFKFEEFNVKNAELFDKFVPVNLLNKNNSRNLLAFQSTHDEILNYKNQILKLQEITDCKIVLIKLKLT